MAQRVTIKSIAEDLGISHMTVSRALSNHPSVKEDTRQAILQRVRELGYVKSAVASAMRGEATGNIGLLLPNIVNEFYARYANALALACDAENIQVITHLTNDDLRNEAHAIRRLREVQADAVVMVPTPGEPDIATRRHLAEMKVIQLIRRRDDIPQATDLLLEDETAIAAAVTHLAQRGHQRIAYIGAHTAISSGRERLAAFESGMNASGLELVPTLIHTAPPSFEMGQKSAGCVLQSDPSATALVCGGFEISNGALDACLRADAALPQDLAFIGYGDPAFYEWIKGGVSTIALPADDLARETARLLTQAPSDAPKSLSLPAELTIRTSG